MSSRKLKFALFGNAYQAEKSACISRLMQCLVAHGAEVCAERRFHGLLSSLGNVAVGGISVFDGSKFDADFVVSLGGDGTILRAAGYVGDKGTPIIGVNTGRLGFLAGIAPDEIEAAFGEVFRGEYELEHHSVITAEGAWEGMASPCRALNDIAVLKRDTASMITIHVMVNGEYLVTYQADGLIVCTPTGSTAYSLSNGGPVIAPSTGVLCLTPVAPHSLNIRPMVIPDSAEIRLSVESRSHNFLIAADGRSAKCGEGTDITIRRAGYDIHVVKRIGHSYFDTLRKKMMWGADPRTKA